MVHRPVLTELKFAGQSAGTYSLTLRLVQPRCLSHIDEILLATGFSGGPRPVLASRGLLCRLAAIEFGNDLGADPVQLLFGEDAQQRPREIKRVEDETGLPTSDPMRFGVGKLMDALITHFQE